MANPSKLQPNRPNVITSDLEVYSFYDKMDPSAYIAELIEGEYVLIEDYYHNGLQVLEALKRVLKKQHPDQSFQAQRDYRKAFWMASHRLLLQVADNDLVVLKAPKIGWIEKLYPDLSHFLIAFPDVQGLNSSWQWYQKGIEIDVLGIRIHPFYGVYFPTRFEHLELFDQWLKNYKGAKTSAFDVGVGSGILSFLLLQHGFSKVIATDTNKNAIISTSMESKRLSYADKLSLEHGDLFGSFDQKADLIVFNPPWLVAKHALQGGIDQAIYYQPDLFTRFFRDAKEHLAAKGKVVILFSNLGQVVDDHPHPIRKELEISTRFKKIQYMEQEVQKGSKRTRRKNWRKHERVELWVLAHADR